MEFAKNLLLKYGWKEGEGIGKNADGIVKPVKASLKFDNAGLSYDRGKEFTDHWWETAFNNAANNLNVSINEENVSLSVHNEIEVDQKVTDETKYMRYFEKSSTDLKPAIDTESMVYGLTDEALLKACNGRTAHKGARHGLSLIGKLNRIEAQEKQLMAKNSINTETAQDIFKDWIEVKKKKHKKVNKEDCGKINSNEEEYCTHLIDQDDYKIKYNSKKKKRQERERDEDLAKSFSNLRADDPSNQNFHFYGVQNTSKAIKKETRSKKKKNKKIRIDVNEINRDENDGQTTPEECGMARKNAERNRTDALVKKLNDIVHENPDRKIKVIHEDLTPFQIKRLLKAGFLVKTKLKKRDKRKEHKERAQLDKINKTLANSHLF